MNTQIYVNLPVKDLDRAVKFYSALGFGFNPQFTNAQAACMIVSEGHIYVMLLVEEFFKGFTPKAIADAQNTTEVLLCISRPSRAEVDDLARKAMAAGGSMPNKPQDHGFMYQSGFQDLDGHIWELMYMDIEETPPIPGD